MLEALTNPHPEHGDCSGCMDDADFEATDFDLEWINQRLERLRQVPHRGTDIGPIWA